MKQFKIQFVIATLLFFLSVFFLCGKCVAELRLSSEANRNMVEKTGEKYFNPGDSAAAAGQTGGGSCFEQKDPNIAQNFILTSYDDKKIQLSDLKGKIVVLEWFNYDCPFVKAHYSAGTTKKLLEKYAKQNVVWLIINSTYYATHESDRGFAESNKITAPILLDKDGTVGMQYEAKTTPHVFVIGPKGKIVYQGACDNAPLGKTPQDQHYLNYVENTVDSLLAEKNVSLSRTKPYGCSVKYAKAP